MQYIIEEILPGIVLLGLCALGSAIGLRMIAGWAFNRLLKLTNQRNAKVVDVVDFLSTYVPPSIEVWGKTFEFQLFINHAHYDTRICYTHNDEFLYLFENIENHEDLVNAVHYLRSALERDHLLPEDYKTSAGYPRSRYQAWIDQFKPNRNTGKNFTGEGNNKKQNS